MVTESEFYAAWDNFMFDKDNPTARMKEVVKQAFGLDIMHIQAMRVLECHYCPKREIPNWEVIKACVKCESDETLANWFEAFVFHYKEVKIA